MIFCLNKPEPIPPKEWEFTEIAPTVLRNAVEELFNSNSVGEWWAIADDMSNTASYLNGVADQMPDGRRMHKIAEDFHRLNRFIDNVLGATREVEK